MDLKRRIRGHRVFLRAPKHCQNYQQVLFWHGLLGALALALVLTLPERMLRRGEIVMTAFAVVAFSIFIQVITMPLVARKLGLLCDDNSERPMPQGEPTPKAGSSRTGAAITSP
jgi:NhaP-type Na+/H+ or K+/H+ antiporter